MHEQYEGQRAHACDLGTKQATTRIPPELGYCTTQCTDADGHQQYVVGLIYRDDAVYRDKQPPTPSIQSSHKKRECLEFVGR